LTVLSRYLTHAVVLVLVVVASGYASVGHRFSPVGLRANTNAFAVRQDGESSEFYLGRYNTIIKPLSIPASASASHTPSVYTVADGDNLNSIATRFKVTTDELRWSNPILHDTDRVTPGVKLTIPPTPGVVVTTHVGDSVDDIAATYHVAASTIVDYNRIRIDPAALPDGLELVIPGGEGPPLPPPAILPLGAGPSSVIAKHPFAIRYGAPIGSYTNNKFPWGWCTWYVATRRQIPWIGDAYQWYGNAQAMGFAVGQAPRVGAVMVTWESGWGHVAYVDAVYPDGSWLVSEMNFVGFAQTDQRQIYPGGVPLIGFVY
jgi:surface antigen